MALSKLSTALGSARLRRGVAAAAVVLAAGGLVLYRAPISSAHGNTSFIAPALGKNAVSFAGKGAHGSVSLSQGAALSGRETTMYADVRLAADADGRDVARAPVAVALVLDTSGSMAGEKIEDGKRSVLKMIADMRDDDEVAFIRYSSASEVIQPLARVGEVRSSLSAKIKELQADGGTNIPSGLTAGRSALDEASKGRVKRIVLVSDGLDGTRARSESIARTSFASGIVVSSLGIGLDFDEGYMGAVAQSGHGNFAFVKDGASLASFLHEELEEATSTTIEQATVRLTLPRGVHFVSATGADASREGQELTLSLGSLFAGNERRVIVELTADIDASTTLGAHARWSSVETHTFDDVDVPALTIVASSDQGVVDKSIDGEVVASAVSVTASRRQVEAADAYTKGDVTRAAAITASNEAALGAAMAAAPAPAAAALAKQAGAYKDMREGFASVAPSSDRGKAAAKSATAHEMSNFSQKAW